MSTKRDTGFSQAPNLNIRKDIGSPRMSNTWRPQDAYSYALCTIDDP